MEGHSAAIACGCMVSVGAACSVDFARLFDEHYRDAVADGEREMRSSRDKFLPLTIVGELAACHRTHEKFKNAAVGLDSIGHWRVRLFASE